MLKDYSNFLSGKFTASFAYKDAQEKWNTITENLNAVGGARKDWFFMIYMLVLSNRLK